MCCEVLFCLGIFSKNLMTLRRDVSFRQSMSLSSEQSPSNLYAVLPEFGVSNPISSKVIREFHLYKDEIVSKLASQNGFNSFPHLLADFFRHARAFSKVPHLMRISPTITSGTPLTFS